MSSNSSPSLHAVKIVSLGEVLWDLFPDGNRFGGAAANFACHAALNGGQVTMLSAVGMDERGEEALRILRGLGIETSSIQRTANAATGTVGVTVDASGKPSFVIHADAAWDCIDWTTGTESIIAGADAVYFGTLGQRCIQSRETIRRALEIARTSRVRRILDVNLRPPYFDNAMILESVSLASVLKLSDEEFPLVAMACRIESDSNQEDALRSLLVRFGLELVAMTRGAEGALLISAVETIDHPGIPTVVCDTVGAGDAFTAAMVMGLCSGAPLEAIARNACTVASATCEYAGAIPFHLVR